MRKLTRPSRAGALIGLTPLLDTLFLLLFAVLSVAESQPQPKAESVRVRLPEVETGPTSATENTVIILTVDEDARISTSGNNNWLTTLTEVDLALSESLAGQLPEEVQIEIQGDRAAPFGKIVALLQHLRLCGFARVDLLADRESSDLTRSTKETR